MPKSIYLLTVMLVGLTLTNLEAQKIKYKDLFPLLNSQKWDEAIPQLRTYLSDPKNADEANPTLQMALYFEEMVKKLDLIKDSTEILKVADSAVLYFKRANGLIDEKELKKNDEYYQAFYRRDLRTGEFGIKISDVQLDIEKKLQSLETIVDNGQEIFKNLYTASGANQFCFEVYSGYTKRFASINELYLMADEGLLDTLQLMADKEANLKHAFGEVRDAVSRIGKKGYSPELEFQSIKAFGEDGLTEADFFQNDVLAWEYGEWAYQTKKDIEDKIGSLKEDMIAFNTKLNDENELLKGLELTPFENITHEVEPSIKEHLNDLERGSFPLKLFTLLIKKNEYDFITKPSLNPRMGNEEDVDYQLMMTDSLVHILNEIEADVTLFQDAYLTENKRKYSGLMNEYGGDFGLIKFRKQYETFLETARTKWNDKNAFYTKKAKWGVSEDGADSIYLNPNTDSLYHIANTSDYFSVATIKDDSSNTFVVGLDFKAGKGKGFMAMVSNARKIVWKENFDLSKFTYTGTENIIGKFIASQDGRKSAYMYASTTSDQENMAVVCGDVVGQIAWSVGLTIKNEPVNVKYNDLVKETVLYMLTEAQMETMSDGTVAYYVIDRSGKIR